MQKAFLFVCLFSGLIAFLAAFTRSTGDEEAKDLRKIYSKSPEKWPAPFVDPGVKWTELGILPAGPLSSVGDSLEQVINLGKILFFDMRVSGSGKIACASCHQPELSWTDGKAQSLGHEGTVNKRNSPTIQNVWFYKTLFWDGRSRDLEDQAFAPINSESEMHSDMRVLPLTLKKIEGYTALFDAAYGDPGINPDRIAGALAVFQRTIISNKSRFDEFLSGNRNALSARELKGFHLFRTKARCINCHNGPLFTDNLFHNTGFHRDGNAANDRGRYMVTHKESDIGKFKTPSLRDVMKTGPWMHDGQASEMRSILESYNKGNLPHNDPQIKPLNLNNEEISDLLSFLGAISSAPRKFTKPRLPK